MKNLLLLFISCFLLLQCSNKHNQVNNDLSKQNLKGKVKSIKEITYAAVKKSGEIQKSDIVESSLTTYNNIGNEIEENHYASDGSLKIKFTFKYDRNNKIIERKHNLEGKTIYKYDNKGREIEYCLFKSNDSLSNKYTHIYDSKGNQIEFNSYKSDGSLDSKYVSKFDKKGNEIENYIYNSEGNLNEKYSYKYDSSGYKIESNGYKPDGHFMSKTAYKYNIKGNLIEVKMFNQFGNPVSKSTFKYDSKENLIEKTVFESANIVDEEYTCKFDSKGNEIEENWYYPKNKFVGKDATNYEFVPKDVRLLRKYEYDKKYNWIQQIKFINGKPSEITERQIEYY